MNFNKKYVHQNKTILSLKSIIDVKYELDLGCSRGLTIYGLGSNNTNYCPPVVAYILNKLTCNYAIFTVSIFSISSIFTCRLVAYFGIIMKCIVKFKYKM